jgi:hypothetical protein
VVFIPSCATAGDAVIADVATSAAQTESDEKVEWRNIGILPDVLDGVREDNACACAWFPDAWATARPAVERYPEWREAEEAVNGSNLLK